ERSEEVRDFGPLPRGLEEGLGLRAQVRDRERAAPVLEQEGEPAGRPETGNGRGREREDHRTRDAGELAPERLLDTVDVQLLGGPLIPVVQLAEERGELGA